MLTTPSHSKARTALPVADPAGFIPAWPATNRGSKRHI